MPPAPITLPQLLESRDRRHDRQQEWLRNYPGRTLAVLTIVMPGSVKRDHLSLKAADAAVKALKEKFGDKIVSIETFDLITGYEAFLALELSEAEAKSAACEIEDNHPLGRIFDIDIIASSGIPISRTELGLPSRKCLLCDGDARVCMRTGAHSYTDLLNHISGLVESYQP